ncbi:hypothetical protein BU26DRAFT_572757 [Trematosphaeria pertusa]|uniref:Uncharacterized protein n=1 Tax=Trematosphaeria pertusa TaxID=390896 RepID=A0A6A6HQE5_9PLEO|nr:uncharacterized protein BU26DRAFT_572757 [Trematosphaeria pertusa]KAF2240374.1 hypothetical protein BU26DRAFT_572757 [Trematosphaeria pertusa]
MPPLINTELIMRTLGDPNTAAELMHLIARKSKTKGKSKIKGGVIAGIVIAIIVAVIVLLIIALLVRRRRNKRITAGPGMGMR